MVEKLTCFKKIKNKKIKTLLAQKPKDFNKTPLGETVCLGYPYFLLTGCLGNQLFDSPPYPNTVS